MPLNQLALTTTNGVVGRSFSSAVTGITAGSTVELLSYAGAPGFSYANGRVTAQSLQWEQNAVVLRETLAGETRDSSLVVTADRTTLGASGLQTAFSETGLNIRNLKASNTLKIRSALANPSRNALLAVLAPSTGAGQSLNGGTSQAVTSWPMQLARQLQAQGINASANNFFGSKAGWGAGSSTANFIAGDGRVSFTGAGGVIGTNSLGGNAFGFGAAGTIVFTPQNPVTQFDVYWVDNTAGRTFSAAVDGGAATNIPTTGTAGVLRKTTIAAGALGTHTLTLAWVSGATSVVVGVHGYDDTNSRRELSVLNLSWSGATTAGLSSATVLSQLGNLAPDLTILGDWAINDWRQSVSMDTFQSNLAAGIAQAKSTGDVIVSTPLWDSATTGNAPQQDAYAAATIAVALANDVPVVDVRAGWVSYAAANAAGMYSDSVHPTAQGYAVEAAQWAETIRRIRAI